MPIPATSKPSYPRTSHLLTRPHSCPFPAPLVFSVVFSILLTSAFYYFVPSALHVIGFHLPAWVLRHASFLLVSSFLPFGFVCFMIPFYLYYCFTSYPSLLHYFSVVGLGSASYPSHATWNKWRRLTGSVRRLQSHILPLSLCCKLHSVCFYFYQSPLSYKEVAHGKMSSAFTHLFTIIATCHSLV